MKTIRTLAEWERAYSEAEKSGEQFITQDFTVEMPLNRIPKGSPVRFAFMTAINLIRKYRVPCDVVITELPLGTLARHGWRGDGTCAVLLSNKLTFKGDKQSVHRCLVHEIAHHIAGHGHGHDERFNQIASYLYEREGYPRGKRGDHRGNLA
jgi:hypothetical protein